MDVSVDLNRELNITGENEKGTQNENLIQTLKLKVPEEYANYNKKIVFIFEGEEIAWDLFDENDEYILGKAVTQYESVDYYIWLTHGEKDFRSKTRTLYFNENKDASGEITPEEISGVNTVIALLEEEITKVDNINIVATKENRVTTITITDKEGQSSSVEILDGEDGQDGQDALINGYNTVTIQGGENISIEQQGSTLTINNTYEYDDTEVKQDISDIQEDISDINTTLEDKADKSEIPTKTSDLTNDSGFIDKNVNDLTYYTLKTNTGSLIDLEINSTNYVVSLRLKNQDGTVISTDTIDLPLESVVVGGRYDSVNKKIVLTLENGNTVDIPVGDLIAGLQTEITSNNKLASDLVDDSNSGNKFVTTSEKTTWNGKQNEINISNKLNADLVDDSNSTNKFVTSQEKAQIETNKNAIAGIKNGTTIDNFGDVESALGGKEDVSNKSQTLDNSATKYPSNKAVKDSQDIQDSEIAEMQEILSNIPTTTGTGEEITLDNTMKCKHVADELGGNTDQETTNGYQLLPYPYVDTTKTQNGITYTDNGDGTITVNGTATANSSFAFLGTTGSQKTIDGAYIGGGLNANVRVRVVNKTDGTYTILGSSEETLVSIDKSTYSTGYIEISITNGTTVNNQVIKPLLTNNSSATFEKYTGRNTFT